MFEEGGSGMERCSVPNFTVLIKNRNINTEFKKVQSCRVYSVLEPDLFSYSGIPVLCSNSRNSFLRVSQVFQSSSKKSGNVTEARTVEIRGVCDHCCRERSNLWLKSDVSNMNCFQQKMISKLWSECWIARIWCPAPLTSCFSPKKRIPCDSFLETRNPKLSKFGASYPPFPPFPSLTSLPLHQISCSPSLLPETWGRREMGRPGG